MVDLHIHSTFSDGNLTPAELAQMAHDVGLTAAALTDHDSTDGVGLFQDACVAVGVDGIPGVEISAEVTHGTMHVLGYFVDPASDELQTLLVQIRKGREIRNHAILKKLQACGMALTWDEIAAFAGEDVVGRPHFAQAMMARGYVSTKEAAFDNYLGKGKPAYVDRFRLGPPESIAAIRSAGGVAVLSHPFTLELGRKALKALVVELKGFGLGGVEVFYPEHTDEQVAQYLGLAQGLDLVATGGSDFHGASNPSIRMGTGFGSLAVPHTVVTQLRVRATAS
ncbi:MAG: hypothetical protein A2498_07840 [Lentisphaerae bacterium RIFOXYC12_FULL_60_16]|nr:MAG: hypothetical protein A2498_07840 [Lentisphaerae bacterium RIFOXYC12_FULL_60_16]OGV86243.1 MAG: hypothetical protein A2340_13770 [Lentisphaerae bacterium RIFOXYB12_FULL_60_10]